MVGTSEESFFPLSKHGTKSPHTKFFGRGRVECGRGRFCTKSSYDAVQIHDHSQKHGRISIIDTNPRSNKDLKESLARERKAADSAGFIHPTDQRYGERTVVERVNGRLKDDFGAHHLRVRGHKKVQAH